MSERLTYHSVAQLESLSLDELQSLWELVPTERQKAYRAAYDREVRNAGAAGSDQLEGRVAAASPRIPPEPTVTPTPAPSRPLDVQVIGVTTQADRLIVRLRLVNPGVDVVRIAPDDVVLTLGYVPEPAGPRLPAAGLAAVTLQPGQAADLALVWPWR